MTTEFEAQIAKYQKWREDLRTTIEAYQAWLEGHGHADIQRSLRIYDLVESLRSDRIILAFLGEFSRGKSELINAIFFSDYKKRLLPSDVGRTTMCPTEIFCDPSEEPYVRLLPIESRKGEDSIGALKHKPVEWVRIKLDVDSQEEMAKAMSSLADVKTVEVEEADRLGLLDENGPPSVRRAGAHEISSSEAPTIPSPRPSTVYRFPGTKGAPGFFRTS